MCYKKLYPHRQCKQMDFGDLNSLTMSDLEQSQTEEKKDSEWTKQWKIQLFYSACCISRWIVAEEKCSLHLKCFIFIFFHFSFFISTYFKPHSFFFQKILLIIILWVCFKPSPLQHAHCQHSLKSLYFCFYLAMCDKRCVSTFYKSWTHEEQFKSWFSHTNPRNWFFL